MTSLLSLETLEVISESFAILIGFIGVFVICLGCAKGIWLFLKHFSFKTTLLADSRMELGHHIALGLEFLIGKDIIESLVQPTWDELGKLAVIILLRTVLTIFLRMELKWVREEEQCEK
jgi:uncharacterized membrane protein